MSKQAEFRLTYSIKFDLPEDYGEFYRFYVVDNRMISLTENSIIEITLAEMLDKGKIDPETRHHYRKLYSIGTKNPIIANTLVYSQEFLQQRLMKVFPNFPALGKIDTENKAIQSHVWACVEHICKAEAALHSIYSETLRLLHECDQIIQKAKIENYMFSLPQIEGVEDYIGVFLANTKKFVEKVYGFITFFFGCPNYQAKFEKYRNWLQSDSRYSSVLEVIDEFIDENIHVANLRNCHSQNHSQPGQFVEIRNITFHPGNKFSAPSWRFDLSKCKAGKKVQNEYTDLLYDTEVILNNVSVFFQAMFTACMNLKDGKY